MPRWHAFTQLILARVREFVREPHALFWVYGFPLILAIGLGLAFAGGEPPPPQVDVQATPDSTLAEQVAKTLNDQKVNAEVHSAEECGTRFERGKTALYLVPEPGKITFVYDPARSDSVLGLKWVQAVLAGHESSSSATQFVEEKNREPGRRYIDWFMPGLIGMNIMGGGLFGVGFILVDMRVRKLFKRLMATPMHRGDFLLSLLSARMLFLFPEMAALLLAGWLLFGVPIKGSWLLLLLTIVVGASAFSGIGLLIGCRTEKNETMSGFINLVMLPMYLLSGIFFSSERFPQAMQPFIQALPLTQLNEALRDVMLKGEGLDTIGLRLAGLAGWAIVTFFLALRWFKWR
jgi:ABC-2 type transport system permease protein